jgi:hypothetical protein
MTGTRARPQLLTVARERTAEASASCVATCSTSRGFVAVLSARPVPGKAGSGAALGAFDSRVRVAPDIFEMDGAVEVCLVHACSGLSRARVCLPTLPASR